MSKCYLISPGVALLSTKDNHFIKIERLGRSMTWAVKKDKWLGFVDLNRCWQISLPDEVVENYSGPVGGETQHIQLLTEFDDAGFWGKLIMSWKYSE